MNEQGPSKTAISREELERMKERWVRLNADYDGKFWELLKDPVRQLSPAEYQVLKAAQQELATIENRVLESARE